jgi:hypothetical protein
MASLAKRTKAVRLNKKKKAGRARKRALAKNGTTAAFPIHKEEKAKV